ncbi:hypothetical protein NIES4106_55670 (plasmid) [Fischerella sp. NIES-4106]|nr:hypothetical protein NIES4106_55670 [Fischerella sp. NIES-4106]
MLTKLISSKFSDFAIYHLLEIEQTIARDSLTQSLESMAAKLVNLVSLSLLSWMIV